MISFIRNVCNRQIHGDRGQVGGCQGLEEGEMVIVSSRPQPVQRSRSSDTFGVTGMLRNGVAAMAAQSRGRTAGERRPLR